ncbi:MAG TPA: UDP-N-acetylmuramate dehydrogenase [Planctomycetaceae bacterium]|nr:UDP-N-acetylmuramate dehydrogenase [Planctomycetaceae bacterium]HQZ66057.1 UDP-N-acetylmuramate dehydrogenase [Planctomycetaceae bacterium]
MTKSIEDFSEILQRDERLSNHTWLRLGGPAEYFVTPRTEAELLEVIQVCRSQQLPIYILGSGSNLLVREAGVKGVVIKVVEPLLGEVTIEGTSLTAGGGALLSHVVAEAVRSGLGGIEDLVGIPGTIAGAVVGNSGGRTGDIGQLITSVRVLTQDNKIAVRHGDELSFSYRRSGIQDLLVLSATLELIRDDSEELPRRMRKNWIMKRSTQPLTDQSAGCVFRNPRGLSAGALIEQCGLKGLSVGKARISERHANFVVTEDGATTQDVEQLIAKIQKAVAEKFAVDLELEIKVW